MGRLLSQTTKATKARRTLKFIRTHKQVLFLTSREVDVLRDALQHWLEGIQEDSKQYGELADEVLMGFDEFATAMDIRRRLL